MKPEPHQLGNMEADTPKKYASLLDALWLSDKDRAEARAAGDRLERAGYEAPSRLRNPDLSKAKGVLAAAFAGGIMGGGVGTFLNGGRMEGASPWVGALTGAGLGGLLSLPMSDNRRNFAIRTSKEVKGLEEKSRARALHASLYRNPATRKLLEAGKPISVMVAIPEQKGLKPYSEAEDLMFDDQLQRDQLASEQKAMDEWARNIVRQEVASGHALPKRASLLSILCP